MQKRGLAGLQMPKDWEPIKAAVAQRSVHAAPFRCTETIESVGTLFSAHGAVNQVRLQRNPDANGKGSHFAGSVIVEMATQAAADALLAATLERHGATLRLQSKSDYLKALSEVCSLALVRRMRSAVHPIGARCEVLLPMMPLPMATQRGWNTPNRCAGGSRRERARSLALPGRHSGGPA